MAQQHQQGAHDRRHPCHQPQPGPSTGADGEGEAEGDQSAGHPVEAEEGHQPGGATAGHDDCQGQGQRDQPP